MIEAGVRYPTAHEDWVKIIVIGGVLTFLGFLVLPLFVVYGYVVRAISDSIDGETAPPGFDDWGSLLVDGLQAWFIHVIYLIIPGIVATITIGGAIAAIATGEPLGAAGGIAGLFGGLGLTVVLALVFSYLAVAAIVNFANEGRFGAAFDVGRIRELVLDGDFAAAWIVSVVAFIIAAIVAGVPVIGFILGPFVTFYVAVVAARLWADGFLSAVDATGDSSPIGDDQPVA